MTSSLRFFDLHDSEIIPVVIQDSAHGISGGFWEWHQLGLVQTSGISVPDNNRTKASWTVKEEEEEGQLTAQTNGQQQQWCQTTPHPLPPTTPSAPPFQSSLLHDRNSRWRKLHDILVIPQRRLQRLEVIEVLDGTTSEWRVQGQGLTDRHAVRKQSWS